MHDCVVECVTKMMVTGSTSGCIGPCLSEAQIWPFWYPWVEMEKLERWKHLAQPRGFNRANDSIFSLVFMLSVAVCLPARSPFMKIYPSNDSFSTVFELS